MVALLLIRPGPGSAQGFSGLVEACGGASPELTALCHGAAAALDAGRGGLASAVALGSETPGTAGTLGHRLRGSPRFALSARGGTSRFSVTDLSGGPGSGGRLPSPDIFVPSLQVAGTLGVLNGFSPFTTVGGLLALDLSASAFALFPPERRGFQDGVQGLGLGLRLGLLRESFTLPGVSVSVNRRWLGSVTLGDLDQGSPAEASFDADVTSYRALVGKDILGVGLLAGGGWDETNGKGAIRARLISTDPVAAASASRLEARRAVYFIGASRTFLILQLSAEAGWSRRMDPDLTREPSGSGSLSARAYFASLAARVTF